MLVTHTEREIVPILPRFRIVAVSMQRLQIDRARIVVISIAMVHLDSVVMLEAQALFAPVPPEPPLTHAIMDKGYDSDRVREHLIAHDIVPVIPPRSNWTVPIDYEKDLYKLREKVERFFNNLKQFRHIATRYEKLSQTFLAFIHLAAAWILVK